MKRFYLDTSIWLDYYENRGSNGEFALKLIRRLIKEDSIIIYSDLHIIELKNLGYSLNEIYTILKIAKDINLRFVHTNKKQIEEVKKIKMTRAVPYRDILHCILARDNEALMVSTDKHFEYLKDIVRTAKPIELI